MLEGDRAAATAMQRAASSFSAALELDTYRTEFTMVPAKVTSYTVVTADLKWKYDWEEVRFTASSTSIATKTNGLAKARAGFAYNWNELANAVGHWSPLGFPGNVPVGFNLKPIATGTPVLLFPIRDTTGKVFWCFDKVNAIDGECP
jgi:acyl-CoA reductase-like NAD-dependent aldehyde dehydrogenase